MGLVVAALSLGALMAGCRKDDAPEPAPGRLPLADDVRPREHGENLLTGPLKPYTELARILEERLFVREGALALRSYYEDEPDPGDIVRLLKPSLADLLGSYDGDGLRAGLRNATPNSVNMLLWYMILDTFALELGAVCDDGATAPRGFRLEDLKPAATAAIRSLCAWPLPEAKAIESLHALWEQVLRADAPDQERRAWLTFVQGPSFEATDGKAAVRQALVAMTYNPYFLLQP
jgi:hypothetical protein